MGLAGEDEPARSGIGKFAMPGVLAHADNSAC